MDCIKIVDLEIFGNHGLLREENALGQKFLISANLYLDTRRAGICDVMEFSVDYNEVCHLIYDYVKGNTYNLIETVSEELAEEILLSFPLLEKVDIEVKKPWAPIGLPLSYVSVNISRGWHTAYLSVGSNMGDKEKNLNGAMDELSKDMLIKIVKKSKLCETKPYGYEEQDDFVNDALEIKTLYTPEELLDKIHDVEKMFGRVRDVHWGPRTLDIDIIMYDSLVMNSERLTIPHADMHNRKFVLKPLAEINEQLVHPVFGKTVGQMLTEVQAEQIVNCDSSARERLA